MNQSQAETSDKLILLARKSSFKCTAIVRMKAISFLSNEQYPRNIDQKNVERIKRIFNTEGCFRLDKSNSIPVLANNDDFQLAMRDSAFSDDGPYPYFNFNDDSLICLHGRHRLTAAYEYLPPMDQFWVVDIYVDPNEQFKNHVIQDFTNALNISDGEIWRYIRLCNKIGDNGGEGKWWSRLTKGKDQDLHQLIRHPHFCRAFDTLLVFPGLWAGLQLGTLHRFLSLKCDEEILHYLHYIHMVWSGIFADCANCEISVDWDSVKLLQLRAPNASRKDNQEIRENMGRGKLFPLLKDERIRGVILHNILATKRIIPSLFTFFEDLKYLEPLANSMKKLIEPMKRSAKTSVYREFQRIFTIPATQPIGSHDELVELQLSEGEFGSSHGSLRQKMEFGYRQLWMYAMRHFPDLVSSPPLKENGQPKPLVKEVDHGTLIRFADLAYRFGFDSPEIRKIRSENPNYQIALAFLQRTKPTEFYLYDQSTLESNAKLISNILGTFPTRNNREPQNPKVIGQYLGVDYLNRRCGRPFEFDYERDKNDLFITQINTDPTGGQDNEEISSFFVKASFYLAFFGSDNLKLMGPQNSQMEARQLLAPLSPVVVGQANLNIQVSTVTQPPPPIQSSEDLPMSEDLITTNATIEDLPMDEARPSVSGSRQKKAANPLNLQPPLPRSTRTSSGVTKRSAHTNVIDLNGAVQIILRISESERGTLNASIRYENSHSSFIIDETQYTLLLLDAARANFVAKDDNDKVIELKDVRPFIINKKTKRVLLQPGQRNQLGLEAQDEEVEEQL